MGVLSVIVGPMFSGKTTQLIAVLRTSKIEGEEQVALKPRTDKRYRVNEIVSHDGLRWPSVGVTGVDDLIRAASSARVAVVDEAQFLPSDAADALRTLSDEGASITVAALDRDFRGELFPITARLLDLATSVVTLKATCGLCGAAAGYTQRLIRGKPAPLDSPVLLVGGSESYQPRCESCFRTERDSISGGSI